MRIDEVPKYDLDEIQEMEDGWDIRHQMHIRVVGTSVWWLARMWMAAENTVDFTPMHVIRTYPGFHYQPGEKRLPDSEEKQ